MLLTATETASIARTLTVAGLGFRAAYRLTVFEIHRTRRYLTSDQAIAFYRNCAIALGIICCAVFVAGWICRSGMQHIVDIIVEDAIAPTPVNLDLAQQGEQEGDHSVAPNVQAFVRQAKEEAIAQVEQKLLCKYADCNIRELRAIARSKNIRNINAKTKSALLEELRSLA